MAASKKKFAKETPPAKFVSEVARLRKLQQHVQEEDSALWLAEIAVQIARLVAQLRYSDPMNDVEDSRYYEDVPF